MESLQHEVIARLKKELAKWVTKPYEIVVDKYGDGTRITLVLTKGRKQRPETVTVTSRKIGNPKDTVNGLIGSLLVKLREVDKDAVRIR